MCSEEASKKRVLCIGDSNTWGYDPRSYFGSQYPVNLRWTGLLEQAGMQIFNCGENGLSIPGKAYFPMVEKLIRSRLPLNVVTVMLGSNDLLEGAAAEEAAERMKRFLPCIVETVPEARVILISPPVMKVGAWVQDHSLITEASRLSALYRGLAAETGVAFADAENWGVELTFDGVHFSPAGHRAFAEGLVQVLKEEKREDMPE